MFARSSWRWWQRIGAACLAAWFAVVVTEIPGVHSCAMHGGRATDASMSSMTMSHAMHALHTSHGASMPAHQHVCSCLGYGCAATSPATPAALDLAALSTHLAPARATGRPDHEYVASWVDFLLPFATAPPTPLPA